MKWSNREVIGGGGTWKPLLSADNVANTLGRRRHSSEPKRCQSEESISGTAVNSESDLIWVSFFFFVAEFPSRQEFPSFVGRDNGFNEEEEEEEEVIVLNGLGKLVMNVNRPNSMQLIVYLFFQTGLLFFRRGDIQLVQVPQTCVNKLFTYDNKFSVLCTKKRLYMRDTLDNRTTQKINTYIFHLDFSTNRKTSRQLSLHRNKVVTNIVIPL